MSYKNSKTKKKIAFTLGDLGGIGPEIYKKFLKNNLDKSFDFVLVDEDLNYQKKLLELEPGKPSKISGVHAYEALKLADQLCRDGKIDYLITGPVAKESLWLAGIQVSGQTELLAKFNELSREDIEMFFVLDEFRTVLATRHIPIKDVPEVLEQRLKFVLKNSISALKNIFNIANPSIAVAGLNPHAGENGIIGLEEKIFMKQIISDFVESNPEVEVSGPYSPDSMLAFAAQKYLNNQKLNHDLYVAAYHDQVLPLIKGIGGLRAINLTVGLPYIRLSVDHGTGFDIVNRDIASPEGFESCLNFCKNTENIIFSGNI
jgi:4-hydroxythreonine-4-phosphate dehydrogenase